MEISQKNGETRFEGEKKNEIMKYPINLKMITKRNDGKCEG